jgi:hypothetical protein
MEREENKSEIQISRKTKKVFLLRYLLGKIEYQTERIAVRDILALFQCLLYCQDLAMRDPNFQQKFGSALEALAKLLKGIRFTELNQDNLLSLKRALRHVPKGFILPQRNLSHAATKVEGLFQLTLYRRPGLIKSLLPMKLWLGKGYSDKGTARNLAIDGSPRWQEVAMKEIVR